MIATAPPPVVNRVANYLAPAPPLPVPETAEGKRDAWSQALFAAAMFYQSRLAHPDPDVAERAARALFDLEKTRLRHGRELAGTPAEPPKPDPETRKDRPTRQEIQRLGKVVELAIRADDVAETVEEDECSFEEREDAELVERFARTPAFQEHVEAARRFIREKGLPDDIGQAVLCAKLRLMEELRRKRADGSYPLQ